MKGSPLLRTGLVLSALLLLLPLLFALTNRPNESPALAAAAQPQTVSLRLTITSTNVPFHFAVSHLGKIIWSGESGALSNSKTIELLFPKEGIDLLVEASWPQKTLGAVRLEVTPPAGAPLSQTLWGNGGVNDVLTFVAAP